MISCDLYDLTSLTFAAFALPLEASHAFYDFLILCMLILISPHCHVFPRDRTWQKSLTSRVFCWIWAMSQISAIQLKFTTCLLDMNLFVKFGSLSAMHEAICNLQVLLLPGCTRHPIWTLSKLQQLGWMVETEGEGECEGFPMPPPWYLLHDPSPIIIIIINVINIEMVCTYRILCSI